MAKIQHIAITTQDPARTAAFYKEAFDLEEIRRDPTGEVRLTDGYVYVAVIKCRTAQNVDVGPNGPNYSGIHHIGFHVDDIEQAIEKLKRAGGKQLTQANASINYRSLKKVKWLGPDGVVLDVDLPRSDLPGRRG